MFARTIVCAAVAALILVQPALSAGDADAVGALDPLVESPGAVSLTVLGQDHFQVPAQATATAQFDRHEDSGGRMPDDQTPDHASTETKDAALEPGQQPASLPSPASPHAGAWPFGLDAAPLAGGPLLAKWSAVEAEIRAERDILAGCRDTAENCPPAARTFLAIVAAGSAQSGRARIGLINRAVNLAIRPMSDLAQWGVVDRWSAPLETLATGRGDCEDYAIAKYVALIGAGVAADAVKLVIVRNTALGEDHAVVAVRLDGKWIMLDNRWLALVEDTDMPGVVPLFVLDGEGVRRFAPAVATAQRGAPAPAAASSPAPASL